MAIILWKRSYSQAPLEYAYNFVKYQQNIIIIYI